MVKKYASIAAPLKKKISPHKLRSTFGTNLYKETGDIYLVADVLGHYDVNTTRKHYAAISEDHRRIAAQKTILREDSPHADIPDWMQMRMLQNAACAFIRLFIKVISWVHIGFNDSVDLYGAVIQTTIHADALTTVIADFTWI